MANANTPTSSPTTPAEASAPALPNGRPVAASSDGQAQSASRREQVFRGMACLDTSNNPRIPQLMKMVGAVSRAKTPQEVLHTFGQGMQELSPTDGYISLSTRDCAPGEYRITRMYVNDEQLRFDPGDSDPWHHGEQLAAHTGGFFGEIIRSAYPEVIHHLAIHDDPVIGDALSRFGSMMAVPLFDAGEPVNWAVMLRRDPEGFTIKELEDSILRGNLVGGTVKNTLIATQLHEAHRQIRAEVDRVAAIQRALLPQQMPTIPGMQLAASYQTFDQAGGDYYDFIHLGCEEDPVDRWALLIADASGHGPAAAVMMAMLHAILHAYPTQPQGPAQLLQHANHHLSAKRIESSFITAFLAFYDAESRELRYARARHNPPLLKRAGAGQPVQRLDDVGSVPLGILDDIEYDEATITLQPGQSVVMYTDGVTEALNPAGEMFGLERIEHALTHCTGQPDCVVDSVTTALLKHEAGVRPADDQTIVIARVE